MSITREEAIKELERLLSHWDDLENGKRSFRWYSKDAVGLALTALRPVSREQVERIWFREPYSRLETRQWDDGSIVYSAVNTYMACWHETPIGNFCHNCGAAQTREAVDILLGRLEAMKDAGD